MTEGEWIGTNERQFVPNGVDRIPEYDPRSGDHLWIILTMYRWGGPAVELPVLDTENLLSVQGPGCYYCEQPYSQRIYKRRCPGMA